MEMDIVENTEEVGVKEKDEGNKENIDLSTDSFPPLPQRKGRALPRVVSGIRISSPTVDRKQEKKEVRKEENKIDSTRGIKTEDQWTEIVKKRGRKDNKRKEGLEMGGRNVEEKASGTPQPAGRSKLPALVRKPPRTATVTITCSGSQEEYNSIMKKARSSIQLDQIGIDKSKLRRAANGGYVIEIPGPDNHTKADTLANKLKEVLPEGVRVGRPMLKGEMRI